jgi:peptidyl-prolyl cis-trans isomerase C
MFLDSEKSTIQTKRRIKMHQTISFVQKTLFVISMLMITFSVACAEEAATKVTAKAESPVNTIAARVNGKEISSAYLDHFVKTVLADQPKAQLSPETYKKIKTNVLETLITMELLYQSGQKLEIKDLDKLVNNGVAKLKAGSINDPFLPKSLVASLTENELRNCVREQIVISKFIDSSIVPKISVSDEEIKRYYDQNIDRFTQEEQVRLHQMVIGTTKTMSVEEKKKARELAEKLHEEILKGAGFVQLAKEYSTINNSKFGGDTGYLTRKQLEPAIAKIAFSLKLGELSDVVETPFGFQFIKLRDRRKAQILSLDEAKAEIKAYLINQKKDPAVSDFLTVARKKADIVILAN